VRGLLTRMGLAVRLQLVLALVVIAGLLTAWLVALAVAPGLFAQHMHQAGPGMAADTTTHAEQAFTSANTISLSAALAGALLTSALVSLYLTRRLGRTLRPLSHAASAVAAGRYDVQVASPGLGPEFDGLVQAFNQMATRLHQVEESRRRLLADLAHELRTPVATLDAYLEALEDHVVSADGETLTVMSAQTARLTRLAEDVGAVSRTEEHRHSMHPHPVSAAEPARLARDHAAERFAAKGVTLQTQIEADLPLINVDLDRFGQVLDNLLTNALRYTPVGGTVTLTATRTRSTVVFTVADNGSGIAAEHLPHIFERFYRTDAARDRAHGGSGIGLAIARALVEAHGGHVGVTSPGTGHGTTFTVTLPISP
jgi:two-component system, OmpR family, sensor histidine kinase BaeS